MNLTKRKIQLVGCVGSNTGQEGGPLLPVLPTNRPVCRHRMQDWTATMCNGGRHKQSYRMVTSEYKAQSQHTAWRTEAPAHLAAYHIFKRCCSVQSLLPLSPAAHLARVACNTAFWSTYTHAALTRRCLRQAVQRLGYLHLPRAWPDPKQNSPNPCSEQLQARALGPLEFMMGPWAA